jgi:hypothetical protein
LHEVSKVGAESKDDLKKLLQKKGYSDNAVGEILKWYEHNLSDRKA